MSTDTQALDRLHQIVSGWEPDEPQDAQRMMQVILDNFELKLKPQAAAEQG